MRKFCITLTSFLTLSGMLMASAQAQSYCENGSFYPGFFWIESVSSGAFENVTGPVQYIPNDQDRYAPGYADYSNQVISWQAGPNPLELVSGAFAPGLPIHWQVWIDLNSDYIFTGDELVLSGQTSEVVNETIDLSDVSADSELTTRMRISLSYGQPEPACGSFQAGEVEDYTVTITAPQLPTVRVPEDYTTIQAAIDAAMPGDRVLVNDGTYVENVVIDKSVVLESVNGYEATIITGSTSTPSILVQAPDVTIKGFDLSGTSEQQRHVQFDVGADDGKLINSFCGVGFPDNRAFQTSVFINDAHRILVDGYICDQKAGSGIFALNSDQSQFVNNSLTGNSFHGILLSNSLDTTVENNILNGNGDAGLTVRHSDSLIVSGNQCSMNQEFAGFSGTGINIQNSSDISVVNNTCDENRQTGINIGRSTAVELIGNSLVNNQTFGVYMFESPAMMHDNFVSGSGRGAFVFASPGTVITNNRIQNSVFRGLVLEQNQNTLIEGNQLLDNEVSLTLTGSTNHVIKNNLINNSTLNAPSCQIDLSQSSDNLIYLNTFLASALMEFCIDNFSVNQWNSPIAIDYEFRGGQFSGLMGNYYSDGDHTDSGMDGIADQAYMLDGLSSLDDYPLSAEVHRYIFN
ncbi:NosD domain-containing protein [Marinicella sp. W31]|uniref:NosD domain-containing protein n=1 Tax=Marinicella sp. W31 TaxID=3023713 RepID=UPI0037576C3D